MTWEALPDSVTIEIRTPKPQPFRLDPSTTALCVVDMQNFTIHNDRMPKRLHGCLAGNVALLDAARTAGAPVIFVQSLRKANAIEVVRFGNEKILAEGSRDAELVRELTPLPGEAVLPKYNHDPWAGGALDEVLAEQGITPDRWTVLVTGVAADICAHAAAIGFSNHDYMTLIPVDCVASISIEDEARTFAQYLGLGYRYNMAFTRSDLVTFERGAPAAEAQR